MPSVPSFPSVRLWIHHIPGQNKALTEDELINVHWNVNLLTDNVRNSPNIVTGFQYKTWMSDLIVNLAVINRSDLIYVSRREDTQKLQ